MTQQGGQDVRSKAPACMAGDICRDKVCGNAVAEQGVRWFITMGHPGYNSPANNGNGYATRQDAVGAYKRYAGRGACDNYPRFNHAAYDSNGRQVGLHAGDQKVCRICQVPAQHPDPETAFEMRAAFGPGVQVVNVITGARYRT